jgi:hypothetical protein
MNRCPENATAALVTPGRSRGSDAIISDCRSYRYRLSREWDTFTGAGTVLWVMLNPSTADASLDDPTIRRCLGFSKAWGFAGLLVGNLFALRSKDPKDIGKHPDPIGPKNDRHLREMAESCYVSMVVVAWGANVDPYRAAAVCDILRPHASIYCLGRTKDGSPRHPLYVASKTKPELYKPFSFTSAKEGKHHE